MCTIGIVALECLWRGKHVYVEKPLTRTAWQARLLPDAVVKYEVATRMPQPGKLAWRHCGCSSMDSNDR